MTDKTHNPMDYIEIDKDKPWLTGKTPNGYWKVERHRLMAIKWLFEERLQWTEEDIKERFDHRTIHQNKLSGLYKHFVRNENITTAYHFVKLYTSGRIKPWELNRTPKECFKDPQLHKKAIRWFFEEKLKWTDEDFKQKLSKETFLDNGFSNYLYYHNSYFDIVEFAYPGRFNPWEVMGYVHDGYWNDKEHGRDAIQWLVQKLDITLEQFLSSPNSIVFREELKKHNLYGLFQEYDSNLTTLKETLFPEYFTKGANDQ